MRRAAARAVYNIVRLHTQDARSVLAIGRPACYHHDPRICAQREGSLFGTNLRCQIAPDSFTISRCLYSSVADSLPYSVEEDGHRAVEGGPMAAYERKIASGHLKPGDRDQEEALRALQTLHDVLYSPSAEDRLERNPNSGISSSGSWFSYLMLKVQWHAQPSVRGLYLYGGVGTGTSCKAKLMDLFFEELFVFTVDNAHASIVLPDNIDILTWFPIAFSKTRSQSDPLGIVADDIAHDAVLLCIDEFMVMDVADALILNRLFDHLFRRGTILVSTSNRHPDQLYEGWGDVNKEIGEEDAASLNKLSKGHWLWFSLQTQCVVHEIGSGMDYRRLTVAQQGMYFTGPNAVENLHEKFRSIADGEEPSPTITDLRMGRTLQVPLAAAGCAYFQFHELCEMPLGAADYFGLFKYFHTLALEGVPIFGSHNRVSAYRFVTLIDVMYEHKARLLCSAEGTPSELFEKISTLAAAPRKSSARSRRHDNADLLVDNELGFAKDRTISRLTEINSSEYQEDHDVAYSNFQRRAAGTGSNK